LSIELIERHLREVVPQITQITQIGKSISHEKAQEAQSKNLNQSRMNADSADDF